MATAKKRTADVPIYVYATQGEADALDKIVEAWAARTKAEKDVDVAPTRRAWFKDMLKREARLFNVEIVEPAPQPEPPPTPPKPAKRGRSAG